MELDKVAVIGLQIDKEILSQLSEANISLDTYISLGTNMEGRILFTLADYLTKYSKKFDRVSFHVTDQLSYILPKGTLTGTMGILNRSEIDIGIVPFNMKKANTETVDFSYSYKLYSFTFVTQKAEYKPQIFSILQTFSLPLLAIFSILFAISLV